MTVQLAVAVRNAMMNAYETAIGTAPTLNIYTGAPPANVTDAATGTLLAAMVLPSDWMAAAANGSIIKAGTWSAVAGAAGTAGYYRIVKSGTTFEQGTVGVSGADMLIDNASIANGQTVNVSTFTKTAAGA